MPYPKYLDCELHITDRDRATLWMAGGGDHSGRPALDEELDRQLLMAALDPIGYGTHLFEALFPKDHDLFAGYDPRKKIALSCSRETAFSRCLGRPVPQARPKAGRPRFLIVLSCPSNLATYDLPEISRDQMRQPIEKALDSLDGRVAYEFLAPPATPERNGR